jgi:RimJ/RimL family protein N-acetyltransferase
VQANIERSDTLVLVARNGGVVVGELALVPSWSGLFSLGMVVKRGWRSKGIGGCLLARAIAWSRTAGAHKIWLEVFPHNSTAIALYERHGFEQEGRFRRHLRRQSGEIWDTIPMGLLLVEPPGR